MAQVFLDLITSFGNCLNCFPGSPSLKINGRNFKILRLLGEVGQIPLYPLPSPLPSHRSQEHWAYGHGPPNRAASPTSTSSRTHPPRSCSP